MRISNRAFTISVVVTLFICLFFMYSIVSASDKPYLNNTKVTIPWKSFEELRKIKVDTILVDSSDNSPVPVLFNKAACSVTIKDSVALCRLAIDYVVLSSGKWVSRVFMQANDAISLSGTECTDGDFIVSTDSGFVLISENCYRGKQKRFACEWYMVSNSENGEYSLSIPVPEVSQCKITASVPSDYSDISFGEFTVISDQKNSGKRVISCVVPAAAKAVELYFARPFKDAEKTVSDSSDNAVSITKSCSKISTLQQSLLFVDNGTMLCLTALTVNPLHVTPSSFTVTIPEHYTLLRIEGNGIRKWTPVTQNIFQVQLTFAIEDSYTAVFIMETENDTAGAVPFIHFDGAAHQSGKFSFLLKGSDEITFDSMGNCSAISGSEFYQDFEKDLSQTITRLMKEGVPSVNNIASLSDGTAAFSFLKIPLNAYFRIRHNKTIPVENAIADSAEITTCLTDDWKLITQVTWSVSQRDKKYLSVSLPDTCEIWQLNVNGKERSPLMDENENVRISLHQYRYNGTESEQVKITMVYFQKIDSTDHLVLPAPIPDIPVSKMSWVVFYSNKHNITRIKGDFAVTSGTLFKHRNQIHKEDSELLYKSIANSGRARKIPMLPDASPKHIYGKKLLVVDEQPVFEFIIKRNSNFNSVWILSFCIVLPAIFLFYYKYHTRKK
ncbi:MAG: hypothetical protein JW915_10850 [Chitinispirillaceae bacterium]|nr:hypothetical protein [Chitinispirillaceae bacterium]